MWLVCGEIGIHTLYNKPTNIMSFSQYDKQSTLSMPAILTISYPSFLKCRLGIVTRLPKLQIKCSHLSHAHFDKLQCYVKALYIHKQSGAVEACWAHNPEVRGSKPRSAKSVFLLEKLSFPAYLFFYT